MFVAWQYGMYSSVPSLHPDNAQITALKKIHAHTYTQVVIMLLDSGRHYIMRMLGERIKDTLRMRLYAAILQQEIGFFDANGKGELMSMLGEDVAQMQMAVTDRITATLTNFTTILYGVYSCMCAELMDLGCGIWLRVR